MPRILLEGMIVIPDTIWNWVVPWVHLFFCVRVKLAWSSKVLSLWNHKAKALLAASDIDACWTKKNKENILIFEGCCSCWERAVLLGCHIYIYTCVCLCVCVYVSMFVRDGHFVIWANHYRLPSRCVGVKPPRRTVKLCAPKVPIFMSSCVR